MLLTQSRFLPLFIVQFLAAFNDAFFKTAVVMLIVYKRVVAEGEEAAILSALVWALYMFSFFVFSAPAGQLSERMDKAKLIRYLKIVDLILAGAVLTGFLMDDLTILLVALAVKGVTSTFFGPIKYAILPERLRPEELIAGNALVEGGTYLAILLSTIMGGLLVLQNHGEVLVAWTFMGVAVAGLVAAWFIVPANIDLPKIPIRWTIATETAANIRNAAKDPMVLWAILGVSWFWMFGTVIMSELPALTSRSMTASGEIVPILLTIFSAGTAVGLALFAKLLKGKISTVYVPMTGLLMSLAGVDVWVACMSIETSATPLSTLQFFSDPTRLRVVADLFLMAVAGGGFTVPLSAMLQTRTASHERSRMIAASNAINSLMTVAALAGAMVALSYGVSLPQLFLGMAVLNMLAAILFSFVLNKAK